MKHTYLIALALICLIHQTVFAQKATWSKKTDFGGLARYGAVSFTINGKAYVGLGRSDLELVHDFWEYDTLIKVWIKKADYPGKGRLGAFAFSIGSKGYVGGGNDANYVHATDFWEYDPATDKWTKRGDFPGTPRIGAAAFSIGMRGYIGTGKLDTLPTSMYLNDLWEFDPSKNGWMKRATFPGAPRVFATAFAMNGKGYIGMGSNVSKVYNDFWEYQPLGDTWTQKTHFPGKARDQAVGFSVNGKAYVGTGSPDKGDDFEDFWEYNPVKQEWKQHVNILLGSKTYAVGFNLGSKGYVVTGRNSLAWYSSDVLEFDPALAIGINEQDTEKSVVMYPNPCNGWLTIRTALPVLEISVNTVLGQELIRQQPEAGKQEIVLDLNDQPNGIYFIQVYSKKGMVSKKMMITGK